MLKVLAAWAGLVAGSLMSDGNLQLISSCDVKMKNGAAAILTDRRQTRACAQREDWSSDSLICKPVRSNLTGLRAAEHVVQSP